LFDLFSNRGRQPLVFAINAFCQDPNTVCILSGAPDLACHLVWVVVDAVATRLPCLFDQIVLELWGRIHASLVLRFWNMGAEAVSVAPIIFFNWRRNESLGRNFG